ncbi:hypothetical protein DB35_25950 [Streptomyces abyssalis]|uniref:Sulfur reduction protein DsrE n=1 Tax=Streptomyces abyssalis TaxID=933944 RepID=A0A1E7JMY5_9ACTN|nr:hypothetical protein [Streptomyces abyssalis]OEU87011.1 hypothetical protein DB35_25950 [Streptomyces abyssalis]OEU89604.1 hypothetical protein AN215_07615 [Streptomyces abyssalis]OEV21085.1 hypothetical protein AN219_27300 [Streptomyces nanshensis]
MTEHLLIESGGPSAGQGCERFVEDALHLARSGRSTSLFLVDNAVTAAVRGAMPVLDRFVGEGGELMVDSVAVRQRALEPGDFVAAARIVEMDDVASMILAADTRVVWH